MGLRNKTLFCGRKRKGHVPQQARRICAKQAHRVPSALRSRLPQATRPPSSATAGRGPAQGRTCVCRHQRVTIAARPARHAHLAQRVRPPRPRPAEGRLAAHPCAATDASPSRRDRYIQRISLDSTALPGHGRRAAHAPSHAGGGQHSKATPCATLLARRIRARRAHQVPSALCSRPPRPRWRRASLLGLYHQ